MGFVAGHRHQTGNRLANPVRGDGVDRGRPDGGRGVVEPGQEGRADIGLQRPVRGKGGQGRDADRFGLVLEEPDQVIGGQDPAPPQSREGPGDQGAGALAS